MRWLAWLWALAMPPAMVYTIASPRTPAEVLSRLASRIDGKGWLVMPWGAHAFVGRLHGTAFSLEKRRWYRNSFAPELRGDIRAAEGGSLITAEIGMKRWVRALLMVCVGPWYLFMLAMLLFGLFGGLGQATSMVWLWVMPLYLALPVGIVQLGVRFGRREAQDLEGLLRACASPLA